MYSWETLRSIWREFVQTFMKCSSCYMSTFSYDVTLLCFGSSFIVGLPNNQLACLTRPPQRNPTARKPYQKFSNTPAKSSWGTDRMSDIHRALLLPQAFISTNGVSLAGASLWWCVLLIQRSCGTTKYVWIKSFHIKITIHIFYDSELIHNRMYGIQLHCHYTYWYKATKYS